MSRTPFQHPWSTGARQRSRPTYNPTSEREFYLLAQHKRASAAKDSKLIARAERNTTTMLQTFLGRLGHGNVQVVYTNPAGNAWANT